MAITADTTVTRVVVACNCDGMNTSSVTPYDGTTRATGYENIPVQSTEAADLAQLQIMQDKIDAGDAEVWYKDGSRWIEYDDLQDVHGLIHAMHPMHTADQSNGYRVLPNIVKNSGYSEDSDTGRPDISTKFGTVAAKRNPDGNTFDYPLENWNARLIAGTQISVELNLTADDNVTDINADDNVLGMLAWLESLRTTGSAVGDDIEDIDDLADGREYRLDLGFGQATLDLEIISLSHITGVTTPTGVYSFVGFTFERVSGETDTIDIAVIRQFIMDATGSIAVASDDTPESPPFDLREATVDVRQIRFPDGKILEPHGERLVLRQSSLGITPLDGSARRIVRYDDLPVRGTGKAMPNDGARVVHFGHGAGSSGRLEFLLLRSHTLSENVGELYEVRNISSEHDCSVYATGGTELLINLKPGQECGFELNEENADGDEEIVVVRPPVRRLLWQRGLSLPNFSNMHLYSDSNANWLSLPWPTGNGVQYRDSDAFSLGTAALPDGGDVVDVAIGDWDIPGSFQIEQSGTVKIRFRYHLLLDADPLNASFALGHGASLWISEHGVNTMTRQGYLGLPEISAIGDLADCSFDYVGTHATGTRFLFLHRVPSGSVLGNMDAFNAYYDEVDLEALNSLVELEPIIRWTN